MQRTKGRLYTFEGRALGKSPQVYNLYGMKILVLLMAVCLLSCKDDSELKKTQEIIKASKEKYTRDSLEIQQKLKIEIARLEYEKATGKKDTLTDEEWLKKAENDFKQ